MARTAPAAGLASILHHFGVKSEWMSPSEYPQRRLEARGFETESASLKAPPPTNATFHFAETSHIVQPAI